MNFSTWAIKNPIPVFMLFFLMTIAGLIGFNKLKIKNFPDLDFPAVTITVSVPGTTPAQLEAQVTRKVENSVTSVSNIKHIFSTVSDGSSVTTVEFELDKNLQEAVDEVKDAVDKVKDQFPAGANLPQISKIDVNNSSILTYEITGSMDPADLSWFVDNDINKLLAGVAGVGKITRQGGVEREVQVLLSPSKLVTLNTTINNISNQLYSARQDFSGGRVVVGGTEQVIRAKQDINNVADLANLNIPLLNSSYVKLKELATIRDSYADIRQMAFLNGKPIISFEVFNSKGSSELGVANAVRSVINKFNMDRPDIKITEISNTVGAINTTYTSSMETLYEGAILAILVVWLFLRDWRATLVAATAIPLSIIPTFYLIEWLGFSLNTVTLLAITLVIGVLVDDAIVEVENIVRHLKKTPSPIKAAIDATTEIGIAVIATSMTLVAVFLPTAFMGGIPGRIFKQFGWSAALAVLMSLLVARLMTPMLAAYFIKPHKEKHQSGWIMKKYLICVKWCLLHRGKTMLLVSGFFVASILLIAMIPTTFFPAEDNNQIILNMELSPGSTIDDTIKVIQSAYTLNKGIKSIMNVYATIGSGVQSGSTSNSDSDVTKGTIVFNLVDSHKRKDSQAKIQDLIQKHLSAIPGAKFSAFDTGMGEKYSLVLAGEDSSLLTRVANQIEVTLRKDKSLGNISSSSSNIRPELDVRIDFDRAAELGITASSIGQVIRVATSGDYDNKLAKLDLPDRQIPIRVKLDNKYSRSIDDIGSLRISGNNDPVPLANLAHIKFTSGPTQISRYDRNRSITLSIDLHGQPIGDVDKKIREIPLMKDLPSGIHQVISGDVERMQEMVGNFVMAMVTGIFLVYCVMVLLFKNFKQPITILSALPLAISGALGTLVLFGFSLSMSSLIGILVLMGIVTKNSILLVDYILLGINEHGLNRKEAIIEACIKRSRPIVMTTAAMIIGMLPIAIGFTGDSSFRAPMAMTVIGGLITSTALSLLVIPVIFELIDDFSLSKIFHYLRDRIASLKRR